MAGTSGFTTGDPYEDDDEVLPFIPEADLKDAAGKQFEVCSVTDALINA
jgi:hypothetical protein